MFQLQAPPLPTKNTVESYLELPKPPQFPDMRSNYQTTVAIPAAKAAQAAQAAQAALDAQAVPVPPQPVESVYVAPVQFVDGLIGSIGYSLSGGNCIDIGGINNPGWGNPIDWPVLTETPSLGATVLFTFNHTARVVGLWSSGDVEVAQENAPGMAHRIPRSEIRGFR